MSGKGFNYPFSDEIVFCAAHDRDSDVIDVDQCEHCAKPGYAVGHPLAPRCPHCEVGIPLGKETTTAHFDKNNRFVGWCRNLPTVHK